MGSWNTVGSHSFFGGEVTEASLMAFFEAWERDSEACSAGRERESFWNFWIGVSVKKREEKLKEQRKMRAHTNHWLV